MKHRTTGIVVAVLLGVMGVVGVGVGVGNRTVSAEDDFNNWVESQGVSKAQVITTTVDVCDIGRKGLVRVARSSLTPTLRATFDQVVEHGVPFICPELTPIFLREKS